MEEDSDPMGNTPQKKTDLPTKTNDSSSPPIDKNNALSSYSKGSSLVNSNVFTNVLQNDGETVQIVHTPESDSKKDILLNSRDSPLINSNVFINTLENDDDTVQIVQTSETLTSGEKKVMPTNANSLPKEKSETSILVTPSDVQGDLSYSEIVKRRNRNITSITFHHNNGSSKDNNIISINSNDSVNVSGNVCFNSSTVKKLCCKIHLKEDKIDICDHCLDPQQIVCHECTKDQNLLVKMGIIPEGLGTICAECVIINSKKCSLHLRPARGYCCFL